MPVLYANNAASRLSASITNTATSFSVTSGTGALFPAISGGDVFYATLMDSAGNLEVVRVTARATDTFTVVRGQDGTTGRAFSVNDIVEIRITRAMLNDLKAERLALTGGTLTGTLNGVTSGSTTTAAFNAATTGGGFSAMWGRYAPFRATVNHTGSSYGPGFSMYYEYTGGYAGQYSLGHLTTSAANPGNFCIHHINSAGASLALWQFDGANGNFIAQGNVTAYSDERLKKDWAALPADFVERLAAVKSGIYIRVDTNERQAGASAQDWQKLLPEVVMTGSDSDKTLSLAYGNAALVSAIELAKNNLELRARIERLELLIEKLLEK